MFILPRLPAPKQGHLFMQLGESKKQNKTKNNKYKKNTQEMNKREEFYSFYRKYFFGTGFKNNNRSSSSAPTIIVPL
jgi:hypothetical protein